MSKTMNLSFAGCGFLGIYHIGVASCFREYAPHLLLSKISGASVGSIAAASLICNVPLGQVTTSVLKVAVRARARVLGPFHPSFDLNQIIREGLEKALPENAHLMCNGRLYISCTRIPDCNNVLLSNFSSREELIQAICCSCYIPFYSGITFPKCCGMSLVDGGISDNLPVLNENTITVSPFAGEHDICPQDESCNIMQINVANTSIALSPGNLYRIARILFPPHPEVLNKMCQQGFDDALKYLQRHTLISCTRCLAVQTVLSVSDTSEKDSEESVEEESEHVFDNCLDCRYKRQAALTDKLPDAVVKAIEEVCDEVNKGVINWLFRHRPMKLLSVLSLPYILPIEITFIIFCKVWKRLPLFQKELQAKFYSVISLIKTLISKIESNRHLYSAKFSCQLAITEFDYTEESISSSYAVPKKESSTPDTCQYVSEKKAVIRNNLSPLDSSTLSVSNASEKQQRRSYAGFINSKSEPAKKQRRKSMCDVRQPERVIRNIKFGFTVDLAPNETVEKQNVIETFRALGPEGRKLSVIEMSKKSMSWERECIGRYQENMKSETDDLGKILDVTSNEAVMSYYYMNDDKTVKVTEIYNVDDVDTSAVLSLEERDVNNKLQWENDWLSDPKMPYTDIPSVSIADEFDDKEFDMSDTELEASEMQDDFEFVERSDPNIQINTPESTPSKPKRKMSFIVLN